MRYGGAGGLQGWVHQRHELHGRLLGFGVQRVAAGDFLGETGRRTGVGVATHRTGWRHGGFDHAGDEKEEPKCKNECPEGDKDCVICETKKDTDNNFDLGLDFVFNNLDRISFVCASHNENSVLKVMDVMKNKNINSNDIRIWFGQLYGMSDNISFNLAKRNYNVFKILPFGSVKNLMPYLIRRAEENTSVSGQTGRELQLIQNEKNRRSKLKA